MTANKQSNAPIIKVLLGCGLVLALGIGGILTVAAYLFTDAAVIDPMAMRAIADDILPGCSPPTGYSPEAASDSPGKRYVVFTDSRDSRIILVETSAVDLRDESGFVSRLELKGRRVFVKMPEAVAAPEASGIVVSGSSSLVLVVGGQEVTFEHCSLDGEGERQEIYSGNLYFRGGKAVVIQYTGPEGRFDQAVMEAFLATVRRLVPAEGK